MLTVLSLDFLEIKVKAREFLEYSEVKHLFQKGGWP
jgi:hypothetical protein